MRNRLFVPIALAALFLSSCNSPSNTTPSAAASDTAKIDGHPAWIMQGNIYEVNVRQYTPEGTFKAFEKHLPRLKEMGVQTLWFMPITPIGVTDRKGHLGSYYAVRNYTAINPEFGTMDDWKALVKTCHDMGFKVITDWVANHTSADHPWLTQFPDFYVKDSTGKPTTPFDWTDARKLNYENKAMQDSMITSMQFWIRESGIDGFRCDVAEEVPVSFWKRAIDSLRVMKNVFMLAEGNKGNLHEAGFDASYTWDAFNDMKQIALGKKPASQLDSVLAKVDTTYPKNAICMYFTSNHDENSWNKADYGTMPGDQHAPFAVITQTTKASVPLIYSGQEEPVTDSLSFFYKDTINFANYSRANFYTKLLKLRNSNPALAANASFQKLALGNDQQIYGFVREAGGKKVVVITNLSAQATKAKLTAAAAGQAKELFTDQSATLADGQELELAPWAYRVYVF
jgi:glycosidase